MSTVQPSTTLTGSHTEVEILHDSHTGLTGKCVVDLTAGQRVQLDKSKLSALPKATTDWPGMKIEKRAVIVEPTPPADTHL